MRVFVTGASGHIGSAVVPELVQAGHDVVGLARSETSAAVVKAMGADVRHGGLDDLDGLREAAADADAVIHLAFDHASVSTGDLAGAAAADLTVVQAFGDALAGTGKILMGIGMTRGGSAAADAAINANPRSAVAHAIAGFTDRDIRSMLVGIPPVVHSMRDRHGFVPTMIGIARATGVSGYLGDGANRWPAAHVLDVGSLYPLALDKAPAGAELVAATEQGVEVREIAETIGRHLGLPVVSIPAEQAADHFKAFAAFMSLGLPPMANESTRQLLGWQPTHPGLIADLDEGHYFATDS
jgi:nucleoside-diphosphate-sugar epimerase